MSIAKVLNIVPTYSFDHWLERNSCVILPVLTNDLIAPMRSENGKKKKRNRGSVPYMKKALSTLDFAIRAHNEAKVISHKSDSSDCGTKEG